MARPRKTRKLGCVPKAVFYMPLDRNLGESIPFEVAIEDFEIVRLVDGHGFHLEAAAAEVGVSRSTAGRMLERARRAIALGIEARAPLYLDASEHLELDSTAAARVDLQRAGEGGLLAVAATQVDGGGLVSHLFGRAPYFLLVDSNGTIQECVENPGTKSSRSAAKKAAAFLSGHGVQRVVAGRYGPDALTYLAEVEIEAFLATGLTVPLAIELYKNENEK